MCSGREWNEGDTVASRRILKVLQNIDDTISLMDADGTLMQTSGMYKPILGYPAEFWESRSIFDLLHPDDALRVLALRDSVLADPAAVVSGELSVRAADGNYAPLMVHAVNRLDDPDVGAIVITSRNISTEKALLADLARARDEALAEVDLRTRLIATVSHELRNPLHALSGMAELLATAELPADAVSLASTLRRQLEGLATVIDDLLESSRLGAGAVALVLRPTTLRDLVEDVAAVGRLATTQEAPTTLVVDVAADVPAIVQVDSSRLRQVLVNLVLNGIKFAAGGTVTIRVRAVGEGRLLFEVHDDGVGIPASELGSVFDAFATASNSGHAAGAGLGLTIVRQLVQLMDGTVQVASEEGSGSTFTVVLPLAEVDAPAPGPMPVPRVEAADSAVLVVEDDEVNQVLATSQLARLGLAALVVGSGEAALDLLAHGNGPDVVLMDFRLPGIDGVEATRRIRRLEGETGRRAVIIGITASAMDSDRAAALAAGMDDFLSKPVGLAALGETLGKWLQGGLGYHGGTSPVETQVLDALAEDLGSRVVVGELVRTFLNELHGRRAALTTAVGAIDIAAARKAAHTLKSSSLLLGAVELGRACQRMETVTHPADLRHTSAEILQRSTVAARWFQNWLARNPSR